MAGTGAGSGPTSRLLALVVTLFAGTPLSGVGLLLLGRRRAAVIWMALGLTAAGALVVGAFAREPWLLLGGVGGVLLLQAGSLIHTAVARKGERAYSKAAWVLVPAAILLSMGGSRALRHWVLEAFQIPSAAMMPTLLPGDHIFVDKSPGPVERGDVIVFRYPPDPSIDYVKRAIALGGEEIEMVRQTVFIDGAKLEQAPSGEPPPEGVALGPATVVKELASGRPYQVMVVPGRGDFPKTRIPAGEIFFLGDLRDNSRDSRFWGSVPEKLVKGRAVFIWWSRDPSSGAIRWSRMGKRIE